MNTETINDIYKNIYPVMTNEYLTVFLCGGAYNKATPSLRDRVRPLLENQHELKIRVFYPEFLLKQAMNKDLDLLTFENILAENSDVIVIICESAGSLVELGAFSNHSSTVDKLIAGISNDHRRDRSFIVRGPIKLLKNKNKKKVFYYTNNEVIDVDEIIKSLRSIKRRIKNNEVIEVDTLVGMYYFIQLLLLLYKGLSKNELRIALFSLVDLEEKGHQKINAIFEAAINLLFKDGLIRTQDAVDGFELTREGQERTMGILKETKKLKYCDKIRMNIMYNEYYKAPRS